MTSDQLSPPPEHVVHGVLLLPHAAGCDGSSAVPQKCVYVKPYIVVTQVEPNP